MKFETKRNKVIKFQNSNVQIIRQLQLNSDVELIQYSNAHELVSYENKDIHTFSMYQYGGYNTFSLNDKEKKGAPGLFCLMPMDSYTSWHIGGKQLFTHLQFSDSFLKRVGIQSFDIDPRCLALPQLTFASNPKLSAVFQNFIINSEWDEVASQIPLEQAVALLLTQLIVDLNISKDTADIYKGGLSPTIKKQVIDYIHTHIHENITLKQLAQLANLSEYHFCRMFKLSLGESPGKYIIGTKLLNVKKTMSLHPNLSLAEISSQCGFAHQSHMGKLFKQYFRMTPTQYRKNF